MLPKIQTIDQDDLERICCLRTDGSFGTLRDVLGAFAPDNVISDLSIARNNTVREIESLNSEEMKSLAREVFGSIEEQTIFGAAINAMSPVEQINQLSPIGESMVNSAKMVLLHTELLIKAGAVELHGN